MPKLVALALPGGPAFVAALQRVWADGDVAFPLDLRLPVPAVHALFDRFGVVDLVDPDGRSSVKARARNTLEPGDALVIASSGTTGEAKGVVHTHDAVAASARITSDGLGAKAVDHWLACLPLSHIGGFSVVSRALLQGQRLTVLPRFEPGAVEEAATNGATLVSLVATALQRIDPGRFRKILLGGAAPPTERPPNAVATYGMTETGSGVVYDGAPLSEVAFRVDDDQQLWVRSPTLFRTYLGAENPTRDGWFPTGDSGSLDADGTVSVFGRMADLIITGGENVWPATVERVLALHPDITGVLVTGAPDPEWGQRVVATLETSAPLSLEAVRDFVKQQLPAFMAPREVVLVDSLPRTASGKVKRPS